ncbi:hypothetical protein SAMN02983003_0605 [Devosia enhydra]|uniref:Uncharacterized protein n=1 Tax=Devosia enhydra TaxID=665118 RepID=A0A1K2HTP1_9HYPH|nr:hypothetical protein [Devosia enhydra]SFZ81633.1 hypothetical protein SAMN02983003_0605 [Devosia enhydra]
MAPTIEGLALPQDARIGPNCGVTAVAVAAGVPFATAWALMAPAHGATWKGRSTEAERLTALAKLGVRVERIHVNRMTLNALAKRLDPTRRYIIRTTGHVQICKGGMMVDQRGARPIAGDRASRKFVTSVLRIVEEA